MFTSSFMVSCLLLPGLSMLALYLLLEISILAASLTVTASFPPAAEFVLTATNYCSYLCVLACANYGA